MNSQHHVLIVTQSCARGGDLGGWLRSEGYCVTCVSTFAAARIYLQMNPSVVITELKLGAYNGLHLAVRASSIRIPVLVLGDRDRFFEHEARQLGTTYIPFDEVSRERIVSYVGSQIRQTPPQASDHVGWISRSSVASLHGQSASSVPAFSRFPAGDQRIRIH